MSAPIPPRCQWQDRKGLVITLVITTAMICGGVLTSISFWRAVQHEFAAVQVIEALGGRVEYEPRLPSLTRWVDQHQAPWLRTVTVVYLGGNAVTDQDVAILKSLPNIRELDLQKNPITDAALLDIAELNSLESVLLTSTDVTQEGLMELHRAQPALFVSPDPLERH